METYISYQVSIKMPDKMRRRKFFTTAGMHVMSSDIRHCNQLTRVCLFNSNLNAELVHILKSNLEGSCLKLDKLDVGGNEDLGTAGWAEVGLVVTQCQVKVFEAVNCNLTAEGMKAFRGNTLDAKIKLLNLNQNKVSKLGNEGLTTISEIVHQCQVETLKMEGCNLNKDQLERFKALIADTGVEFIVD
ncbi:uncharacterized protein LOC144424377 [Styela clava]